MNRANDLPIRQKAASSGGLHRVRVMLLGVGLFVSCQKVYLLALRLRPRIQTAKRAYLTEPRTCAASSPENFLSLAERASMTLIGRENLFDSSSVDVLAQRLSTMEEHHDPGGSN